jgi:hypothetical protein
MPTPSLRTLPPTCAWRPAFAAKLASLRFRIAEIAEAALAHPEWDRAAFARDLRDALAGAEGGADLPEPNRASHFS